MFKVFAFDFETRNETISSLIYCLINEAICWLLTTFQSDAISAHGHTSLVFNYSCSVSVSVGVSRRWCTGVVQGAHLSPRHHLTIYHHIFYICLPLQLWPYFV